MRLTECLVPGTIGSGWCQAREVGAAKDRAK
jgi:hypothetical protein